MTDDMNKRRDEEAKNHGIEKYPVHPLTNNGFTQDINFARRMSHTQSFQDGWDACQAEMQAQNQALKAQVDEFKREEIARQKTFALGHTEIYIRSLEEQLKDKDAQLDISVKALEFVRTDYGGYAKEVEEGSEASYIWEHVSSRAKTEARQALTQIKELHGSSSEAADRKESE